MLPNRVRRGQIHASHSVMSKVSGKIWVRKTLDRLNIELRSFKNTMKKNLN